MEKFPIILTIFGVLLIVAGVLWYFGFQIGNLPGDIKIEKGSATIYIPITTMIIASILLSLIFFVFRFFQK